MTPSACVAATIAWKSGWLQSNAKQNAEKKHDGAEPEYRDQDPARFAHRSLDHHGTST